MTPLKPIASDVLGLAKHIQGLIAQGLDREAVLERLASPAGVGAALIDRAVERQREGARYMGDDFVMVRTGEDG